MTSQKQEFIITLYKIGVFSFGAFKLKGGKPTSIYINLRKIISHPDILRATATLLWQEIKNCEFDLICGVPYAALPVATCMSLDHHVPLIMRRKERKDYGTKQLIEGDFKPEQRCIIVEDVVTTGASIIETAVELENVGLKVTDAVALICREKNELEKYYQPHYVFSFLDVLDFLSQTNLLNTTEKNLLQKFLAEEQ